MAKRLFGDVFFDGKRSVISLAQNTIGINDSVSGVLTELSPPDPYYLPYIYYSEDWNLVGVVPGQDVIVTMSSPDFIVWIDILDATDLTTPLFTGGGPTFTPQAGISYVIRASTYAEFTVGRYTLTTESLGG
jgi:hypothetical protein